MNLDMSVLNTDNDCLNVKNLCAIRTLNTGLLKIYMYQYVCTTALVKHIVHCHTICTET